MFPELPCAASCLRAFRTLIGLMPMLRLPTKGPLPPLAGYSPEPWPNRSKAPAVISYIIDHHLRLNPAIRWTTLYRTPRAISRSASQFTHKSHLFTGSPS